MLKITEPGLFSSDLAEPINLFLGSGFSRLATNQAGQTLPTGAGLQKLLIERYGRPDLEQLDLQSVYTVIANEQRGDLDAYLIEIFGNYIPS